MADVTDAQVDAEARVLWDRVRGLMGWEDRWPWESVGDHMRATFREEARSRLEATATTDEVSA